MKVPQFKGERRKININEWKILGLIALLDPYLSKSCGYEPLTNLKTKQTLMF